jgi:hypothetical protein
MTSPPVSENVSSSARRTAVLLLLALAAALLSIFAQGFEFGVDNNIFHIPVVLRWYDDPRWASDAFVQSLRNFTSYVYPLLGLVATRENLKSVFFVAHVVSRWAAFFAMLAIMRHLGLRRTGQLTLAALVLAATPMLRHVTPIGKSGMLVDYFTHTEVTHGTVLGSLLLLVEGFPLLAFLLNGLTFDINAFVGVWIGVVLGVAEILRQRREGRILYGRLLLFAAANLVVALPTILWILGTLSGDQGAPFDVRLYLRDYFPFHFFIDTASVQNAVKLGIVVACGFAAIRGETPARRTWRDLYRALAGVFVIGMILPYLTGSPLLIKLHLMRIDALLILLTVVFTLATAVERFTDSVSDASPKQLGETAAALVTFMFDWPLAAIGLVTSASERDKDGGEVRSVRTLALAAAIAAIGVATMLSTTLGAGVAPALRVSTLLGAVVCLAIGVTTGSYVAASVSVVLLSQGDVYLFAAGALYMAGAILRTERREQALAATLSAAAGMAGLVAMAVGIALAADRRRAGIAAAMQLAAVFAYPVGRSAIKRLPAVPRLAPRTAMLTVAALGLVLIAEARRWLPVPTRATTDYSAVAHWAAQMTPTQSVFLVPYERLRLPIGFRLQSERAVWVDWKEGGAVMWQPSFYGQWNTRKTEVSQLMSVEASLAYACAHHIGYVVYDRRKRWLDAARFDAQRVYSTTTYDVYAAKECATGLPTRPRS